jgi:hypothetical protein
VNEPVFTIGFPKTGNTSLKIALAKLGYNADRGSPEFRERLWRGDYRLPDGINAMTNCGEYYYAQLDVRYPNARFILTTRNMKDWLRSCETYFSIPRIAAGFNVPWRYITNIQLFGTPVFEPERWEFAHNQHIENVKRYFGNSPKLLVTNVIEEGWKKLCPFLGFPIPNEPFPRANVTSHIANGSEKETMGTRRDVPRTPAQRNRAVKKYVSGVLRSWYKSQRKPSQSRRKR